MASASSRNTHPYQPTLRFWKNEADIPPLELANAFDIAWYTIPYDPTSLKAHNPPLRKGKVGDVPQLVGYIPQHLREPVRMAARILALYQHLAARVSWIDLRAAASSKNQVHLVAFVHQMYSGLRLNAYVAQKVMEHVADKITELAEAESVRKS
ncbi:hypothetical protein GY45DRAFT_1210371, partial [Cubamyces sp. BRFM 1775]